MLAYLRFFVVPLVFIPMSIVSSMIGGWAGCVTFAIVMSAHVLGDNLTRPDSEYHEYKFKGLLSLVSYVQLPVSALALFIIIWQASDHDLWGFAGLVDQILTIDIMPLHDLKTIELLLAASTTGFVISTNAVFAHELMHQTRNPLARVYARWLLALVGDAQFSISHLYGHHQNVGTMEDPATARRGESLYRFAIRSTINQYRESWQIEKKRLRRLNRPLLAPANQVITGLLMTLPVFALAIYGAGARGFFACLMVIAVSKFALEAINYIEHYGLVRIPGEKVEPRHSWDSNHYFSSGSLINLTRHADHHCFSRRQYPDLRACEFDGGIDHGYMNQIMYAFFPFIWFPYMEKKLRYREEYLASAQEKELMKSQRLA